MATDIVMPRLSDSMEEGTVLQWLRSVGDEVAVGDELVEIETDKANMVFEADAAGTLVEIVASEGATLPIGEPIARVGDPSEAVGNGAGGPRGGSSAIPAPAAPRVDAADAPPDLPGSAPAQVQAPPIQARPGGSNGRVKASPLARRIAGEKGVDLATLSGSGAAGRVVKADVEAAVVEGPPAEVPGTLPAQVRLAAPAGMSLGGREGPETGRGNVEIVELTKVQQTVARRMAESKATAPSFYLQSNIDMTRCFEARAQIKAAAREDEVVPSFNDMAIKACAIALSEFPRVNGAYRDGHWELYERINVGIAVADEASLVVPTIFDADRKGLRQIASEARALASRVRDGQITPPELSGATFTVSNLGMYGISNFHPIINSPQAAILGVGEITTAQLMGVTLVCDHRILYGADGAEFLARVRGVLEEPLGLAL
jgi:pyruvate dehydrogenase E2 component (dihydrolipoamide acetyltransferase)